MPRCLHRQRGEMVFVLEEKRRFPRVKLQAPMRYQLMGRHEPSHALADNVSLGGIGFINDHFIPPSSPLQVEFNVLHGTVTAAGKVAWSSPIPHSDRYRVGVEFVDISDKDKVNIADYIDMHLAAA